MEIVTRADIDAAIGQVGVTPRNGRNCTLRTGQGAWPKASSWEYRQNPAILAVGWLSMLSRPRR
jgi:hypothetical protein